MSHDRRGKEFKKEKVKILKRLSVFLFLHKSSDFKSWLKINDSNYASAE